MSSNMNTVKNKTSVTCLDSPLAWSHECVLYVLEGVTTNFKTVQEIKDQTVSRQLSTIDACILSFYCA